MLTSGRKYATSWREAHRPPSGIKENSRALARRLALAALSATGAADRGPFLNCLYCHYVFDDQRKRFARLIEELRGIGKFIDTETCIGMLEGRVAIDGRYFHISFDDGFRNVYTNALPILEEHGVPGAVFVPTGLVGADWHEARHYCLQTTRYIGVVEMVTWQDLKDARARGFEVGSHTRTHKRFADISGAPETLEDEILGSKKDIEERLQTECKYIAWPYGAMKDVDETSLDLAVKAGYRAVFGAFRGTVTPKETSIYSIPRHLFEVQWPFSHVKYFAGRAGSRS